MTQISPSLAEGARDTTHKLLDDFCDGLARFYAMKPVYPAYIASRIKKFLAASDTEKLLREIGDIETIGDCKYAIAVKDFNGAEYRITVEVKNQPRDSTITDIFTAGRPL